MVILLCVIGSGLTLVSLWNLSTLYGAFQTYEQSVGEVKQINTRKVYRYRKIRYEHEMIIGYPTLRYGELYVSRKYYWPFREKGDKVRVWYHPEHPREIFLPWEEGGLWGFLLASGVAGLAVGIYGNRNRNKKSE